MVMIVPRCFGCKHFSEHTVEPTADTSRYTCRAYPNGIPDRWLEDKHAVVQKDQQGKYVYELKQQ